LSAGTGTVLDRILAETRTAVERRTREAAGERPPLPARAGRPFGDALAGPGVGVIAEFKRRSPSAGTLHDAPELPQILRAYEQGGAVAASILTEEPNFGGSLADLVAAREACALPLLCKDFIVDPFQIEEAARAGADAILLIVAALGDSELATLLRVAREAGLDVLVEVHDGAELERALGAGAEIIGVNNRDLRDFSVDVERTGRLMAQMPDGVIVVSESGISSAAQLESLGGQGVQAVLVGETLMRSADPAAALRALLGVRGAL
jgi:indole-3-glycerol phosphate synthase